MNSAGLLLRPPDLNGNINVLFAATSQQVLGIFNGEP
jgi:hypothetical protein